MHNFIIKIILLKNWYYCKWIENSTSHLLLSCSWYLILAHSKVTIFSPFFAPWVLNCQPLSHCNKQDTMIKLLSTILSSWLINSSLVKHKVLLYLNCNSNWSLLNKLLKIILTISLLVDHSVVLYLNTLFCIILTLLLLSCIRIEFFLRNFVLQDILIDILKHTSIASLITKISTAINYLLLRQEYVFCLSTCYFQCRFKSSNWRKSIAWSTLTLIFDLSNLALLNPVNLISSIILNWFFVGLFQGLLSPRISSGFLQISFLELFPSKVRKLVELQFIASIFRVNLLYHAEIVIEDFKSVMIVLFSWVFFVVGLQEAVKVLILVGLQKIVVLIVKKQFKYNKYCSLQ